MTIKYYPLVLLVLNLTACLYGSKNDHQLDTQYSTIVNIENKTGTPLYLTSIHQSTQTQAIFGIGINKSADKNSVQFSVQDTTSNAIANGQFVLNGRCGDNTVWRINGINGVNNHALSIQATDKQNHQEVYITIHRCQ